MNFTSFFIRFSSLAHKFKKRLSLILFMLFISLSLITTSSLFAKEESSITNSVYMGAGYSNAGFLHGKNSPLWAAEGYVGIETKFSDYIALLNTIGIPHFNRVSMYDNDSSYTGFYYQIGMRVFLGLPYLFLDVTAGLGFAFIDNPLPQEYDGVTVYTPIGIRLGGNIPISDSFSFQMMFGIDRLMGDISMHFSAGIYFRLGE